MTSGRKHTPEMISCAVCGALTTWRGGRRKMYCGKKCRDKGKPSAKYVRKGRPAPTKTKNQRTLSDALKIARGHCTDCNMAITEDTVMIIEWDHRDPHDKQFTIAYELNRISDDKLIAEIAKCDAVCCNCHRMRTWRHKHWKVRRQETQHTHPTLFQ